MNIRTLNHFYDTMAKSAQLRKKIVSEMLQNGAPKNPKDIEVLKQHADDLLNIKKNSKGNLLQIDENKEITVDLSYETGELKKDIIFLEKGEAALEAYLAELHNEDFQQQVAKGVDFLKDKNLNNFITDRDGTVNNYCGRYRSSVQSIYNALFMTRFAQRRVNNSVVLTSAPLKNPGLVDVSVTPDKDFIYAASKGREYVVNGERNQLAIDSDQQNQLNELNRRLTSLVEQPEYEKYALIGSGIQYKFGQTTIARQDVSGSVPQAESDAFLDKITRLVHELDPDKKWFRIEDTGKDIEIILTVNSKGGETRDFDKGDGVLFLNDSLGLNVENGGNLVCGDTGSDVPMVTKVMEKSDDIYTIFVTKDAGLRQKIEDNVPEERYLFVTEPDVLVMLLNKSAR